MPREIGVTDLRERRSVVWDEALAACGRTATVLSQRSRVGDVVSGLHGNSCVERIAAMAKAAHLTRVLLKLQRGSDERSWRRHE